MKAVAGALLAPVAALAQLTPTDAQGEKVRQDILNLFREKNNFEAEIDAMFDGSFIAQDAGITRTQMHDAVGRFLRFVKQANFAPIDDRVQVLSISPEENLFGYNPTYWDNLLRFNIDQLIHEAVHFSEQQQAWYKQKRDAVDEINSSFPNYASFTREQVRSNEPFQRAAKIIVSSGWKAEIQAWYVQMAFNAMMAHGVSLESYLRKREQMAPEDPVIASETVFAKDYAPGQVTQRLKYATFYNYVVLSGAMETILTRLLTPDDATEDIFNRAAARFRLNYAENVQLMDWSLKAFPSTQTPLVEQPASGWLGRFALPLSITVGVMTIIALAVWRWRRGLRRPVSRQVARAEAHKSKKEYHRNITYPSSGKGLWWGGDASGDIGPSGSHHHNQSRGRSGPGNPASAAAAPAAKRADLSQLSPFEKRVFKLYSRGMEMKGIMFNLSSSNGPVIKALNAIDKVLGLKKGSSRPVRLREMRRRRLIVIQKATVKALKEVVSRLDPPVLEALAAAMADCTSEKAIKREIRKSLSRIGVYIKAVLVALHETPRAAFNGHEMDFWMAANILATAGVPLKVQKETPPERDSIQSFVFKCVKDLWQPRDLAPLWRITPNGTGVFYIGMRVTLEKLKLIVNRSGLRIDQQNKRNDWTENPVSVIEGLFQENQSYPLVTNFLMIVLELNRARIAGMGLSKRDSLKAEIIQRVYALRRPRGRFVDITTAIRRSA